MTPQSEGAMLHRKLSQALWMIPAALRSSAGSASAAGIAGPGPPGTHPVRGWPDRADGNRAWRWRAADGYPALETRAIVGALASGVAARGRCGNFCDRNPLN